jgi:hypothetical protein
MKRFDRRTGLALGTFVLCTVLACTGQAARYGSPVGPIARITVGPEGAVVSSSDGAVSIGIPPGAVETSVDITVQALTNSPPGLGNAYQVGPAGQVFLLPVTLTFQNTTTGTIDTVTAAFRVSQSFWVREPEVVRDAPGNTVAATVTSFDRTDWTLYPVGGTTNRDLAGTFTIASTVDTPFNASGPLSLLYAGSADTTEYYFPTGSLTLIGDVVSAGAPCVPASASAPVKDTVLAELRPGVRLDWAVLATWSVTCTPASGDPFGDLLSTQFDTLGIYTVGCRGAYVGPAEFSTSRVAGTYLIDCGTRGQISATYILLASP